MSRSAADLLFEPSSIVVYGASADPNKLSGRPVAFLKNFGFVGDLYAVNPHRDVVQDVPAFKTVGEVPGPVDLAIIVVPADKVVQAIEECSTAGVGAAIVFASGFAEAPGDEGVQLQQELAAKAGPMRVLGPNCLGSFALASKAFATFSTAFDTDGPLPESPIALVSQSGAVGTFTFSTMVSTGVGVRYYANPGNQVDITAVELLDGLVDRDDVQILMGHLEGFTDPDALDRLAGRAAAAGKPLLLLKAGRTSVGRRAIKAHTGSDGGDDDLFNEILARHGAIRARSMEEWADLALGFASGRRPAGPRVTLLTQSGGAGALAGDLAVDLGLVMEPWADETRAQVAEMLPFFASTANPLDLTGAMINDVGILDRSLEISAATDETDVVLVVLGNTDSAATELVATCVKHHSATEKPFFVTWTGGSGRPRLELLKAGVPTYTDPARAVRVIAALAGRGLQQGGSAAGEGG